MKPGVFFFWACIIFVAGMVAADWEKITKGQKMHCHGTIGGPSLTAPREPFDVIATMDEFKSDTERAERAGMIVAYSCDSLNK